MTELKRNPLSDIYFFSFGFPQNLWVTFKTAESGEKWGTEMPDLLPLGMNVLADDPMLPSGPPEGTGAGTLLTYG